MCFGIPMRVRAIDGFIAYCEAKGVEREASFFLLQHEEIAVGDYVVVHLGQVIDKVSADEARAAWEVYDEMLGALGEGER